MIKTKILTIGYCSLAILIGACGGGNQPKEEESDTNKETTTSECLYRYDESATSVLWTAFKFTEMVEVSGKFDIVNVSGVKPSETKIGVFNEATFIIPVSSINSAAADRDMKIQKFFFGSLLNTMEMTGKVKSIDGNDESGKFILDFRFNDVTRLLELNYRMSGDTVIASGIFMPINWDAESAVDNLNKECKELHKGTDGVSKLWPDFRIEIRGLVKKKCE